MKGQNKNRSTFLLSHSGKSVSVTVIKEKRRNCRVSVGKTGIIMRFPTFISKNDEKKYYHRFLDWAKEQIDLRPQLFEAPPVRDYVHSPILKVNETEFRIQLKQEERKTYSWKQIDQTIIIKTPLTVHPETVSSCVGSAVGSYFLPFITDRVNDYNKTFFRKKIGKITIRNNSRVWGSCSSSGNLSFSSRLFFAPSDVVDYLVVHELSHLIHPNHSRAFWQTVENCMPDYREKEKWLKKYGRECYY